MLEKLLAVVKASFSRNLAVTYPNTQD